MVLTGELFFVNRFSATSIVRPSSPSAIAAIVFLATNKIPRQTLSRRWKSFARARHLLDPLSRHSPCKQAPRQATHRVPSPYYVNLQMTSAAYLHRPRQLCRSFSWKLEQHNRQEFPVNYLFSKTIFSDYPLDPATHVSAVLTLLIPQFQTN